MKYIEAAKLQHPELGEHQIIVTQCPADIEQPCRSTTMLGCSKCWGREVEETNGKQ